MGLFKDGLTLMVLGMGFVFLFLLIMVVWIEVSSKVLSKFSHLLPETSTKAKPKPQKKVAPSAADDSELVAAISAAVNMHRTGKR